MAAPQYVMVLYEEGYPALVELPGVDDSSVDRGVDGETYLVTAEHLARLDEFEGCPHLYQRKRIRLADKSEADAYVISPDIGRKLPRLSHWDGLSQ